MKLAALFILILLCSCKDTSLDIRGIEGSDRTLAYVYYEKGKAGLLDTNRHIILPAQFDYIEDWQIDGLSRIDSGGHKITGGDAVDYIFKKYGLINTRGQVLWKPQFDELNVSDNSALVRIDSLYGYIDNKGNWLIKPAFKVAYPFYKGTAVVKTTHGFELVDKKEVRIINQTFDSVYYFKNDVAIASVGKQWGLINYKGKFILPLGNYRGLGEINWYYGKLMKEDGKWYLIDTTGATPIKEGFDEVETYNLKDIIYAVGKRNGKEVKVRMKQNGS